VRSFVRQLGLDDQVDFTGRIPLAQKVVLLQTSWAYLQPTSCEGFGLAIGEALACATPVITSPELCVVETYGEAVLYGDSPEEMAAQLSLLVEESELYSTMQKRGIEVVGRYSLSNRRLRFGRILQSLLP
jgi:glycosyltransferase involved in cell wall biosynthesis